MKVLLFGGTTEGRILAEKLSELGIQVTVSVATALGKEELAGLEEVHVLVGRKNGQEMAEMLKSFPFCIDATHPYAVEASRNILDACTAAGVPCRRLLRPESRADGAHAVESCAEAAAFLLTQKGNILLATGAKELNAFDGLPKERLYARVLPTHESIAACEALGLAHKNILALQGPFTQEMNEAMLRQYQISWLVTKDGGREGGFSEKLAAVRAAGAELLLIRRPEEDGETLERILKELKEVCV